MQGFRPIIKRPSISGDIVEQILSKIRSNEFKPGDVLPTEKELSESLFVGRNTVREAMKTLEAIGLIQVVKSRKVICPPLENDLKLSRLEMTATNIHEIFEVRKLLEVEIVGLATDRAEPEDISKIRAAIVLTDKREDIIASDISFHRAIADAAKNFVLSQIYQIITGVLFQVHKTHSLWQREEERREYTAHARADHKKILKAIESHNRAAARRAIREHLEMVEKKLYRLCEIGGLPAGE
jgi:DNA-binding FadR family transcriptional regulator